MKKKPTHTHTPLKPTKPKAKPPNLHPSPFPVCSTGRSVWEHPSLALSTAREAGWFLQLGWQKKERFALDSPVTVNIHRGCYRELEVSSPSPLFGVRFSLFGVKLVLGTCPLSGQQNLPSAKVSFALFSLESAFLAVQTSFSPVCGRILSWCHVLAAGSKALRV